MSEPSEQSREVVRQWATRKIERLEAELAERHRQYDEMKAEALSLIDTIADLRASSVVVRRKCVECGGTGLDFATVQLLEPVDCHDCDNGWRLVDGVTTFRVASAGSKPDPWTGEAVQAEPLLRGKEIETTRCLLREGEYYVIPARLIEGDTV